MPAAVVEPAPMAEHAFPPPDRSRRHTAAAREPETTGPVFTPAPPEVSGPGSLRPTLVIGLGQAGLRVLQRLRFDLNERYGPPEMMPIVRTLYVDTDPDALDDAGRGRPHERLARPQPGRRVPGQTEPRRRTT